MSEVEDYHVTVPSRLKKVVDEMGWSPSQLLTEKIGEKMEKSERGILIAYPSTGEKKTFPVGTSIVDFYEGDVIFADRTRDTFAPNLKMHKIDWAKSLSVYPDKKVTIWLDDRSPKYPADAGDYFQLPNEHFKQVYIETTEETEIIVWAHSEKDSIPLRFIVAKFAPFSGTESGTTTDAYATILTWDTSGMDKKELILKNTGTNSLNLTVIERAYKDGNDYKVRDDVSVAAGDVDRSVIENYVQQVVVQVKSTTAGSATTFTLNYNGQRSG